MQDSERDIELMLLVQGDDDRAFEELIERHQKKVLNLAYKYVGNLEEAEDVAQEVFLRIYKMRKTYKPTAKFATWLYKITVNICLNEIRDRSYAVSLPLPENDLLTKSNQVYPDEEAKKTELQTIVKSAIDALPKNQKMVVILTKYENMSYDKVAEAMDLSVEAVKSLLFRAKDNLKRMLSKYVE